MRKVVEVVRGGGDSCTCGACYLTSNVLSEPVIVGTCNYALVFAYLCAYHMATSKSYRVSPSTGVMM